MNSAALRRSWSSLGLTAQELPALVLLKHRQILERQTYLHSTHTHTHTPSLSSLSLSVSLCLSLSLYVSVLHMDCPGAATVKWT